MTETPPTWITKVLSVLCPEHLQDEIEGDFLEHYNHLRKHKRKSAADRQALGFVLFSAPKLISQRKYYSPNHLAMFKSYLLVAIRNLRKHMAYSLLNILGLSISLTACLLIGLYVYHELSFDKFHKEVERIYRVNMTFNSSQDSETIYLTPTALLPALKREFDEVEEGVRLYYIGGFSAATVQKGEDVNQEKQFFYADSTFFSVFDFKLISGSSEECLKKPRSLVIPEEVALRYFGTTDILNETLKVNGFDYTVTGVLENVPDNSHFQFRFLSSFSTLRQAKQEIWGSANYATYVKLKAGADESTLGQELADKVNAQLGNDLGGYSLDFELMPLTDIHLYSEIADEMQPQNAISYIYVLLIVGLMILVVACINYMNLATARSMERAKEVGMRKVVGAQRLQVFNQFMGESIIIVLLSTILSLVITSLVMEPFNNLAAKNFTFDTLINLEVLGVLISIIILVSILAGAYPSIILSSFSPETALKGNFQVSRKGSFTRKLLVIFQFSISLCLLVGSIVVKSQLSYMQNKRLGYNRDNVIVLPAGRYVTKRYDQIKTALEQKAEVTGVSIATESLVNVGGGYSLEVPGLLDNSLSVNAVGTGTDFIKNMELNLLAGRAFNAADLANVNVEERDTRKYAFVVNEEVCKNLFREPVDVIGTKVNLNGREGEIIGVIEDFHSTSLHRPITPMVLFVEADYCNALFARIQPENIQNTLLGLERTWKELVPEQPFIFEFMDDQYDAMYRAEARLSNVFFVFSTLAVIIAGFGLLGLVSFSVRQRSKEIGVRKVLGASVLSIIGLLNKDFAKLVLVAFVLALPFTWWVVEHWLQDFAYKIELSPFSFLLAAMVLLGVAILTVSLQSYNAANANPTETLRAE
ncbi:MAG: ABC transporter permease [Bacteroidota bacterium]